MKNIPEEFLPLIDWWEQHGKKTLVYTLVLAAAIGGYYSFTSYRASRRAAASNVILNAYTASELEEGLTAYGETKAGAAIRMRLAKKYFDDEKYEDALAIYSDLKAKPVEGFADIAEVGAAQCLEAMGKFADAQKAFDEFAAANAKSYLALTARLGATRAQAAGGDKKGALAKLDAMEKEFANEPDALARIEMTNDIVSRLGKKADAPAAPVAKPAEAPAKK